MTQRTIDHSGRDVPRRNCKLCNQAVPLTINGRCLTCDPRAFSSCKKCETGHYRSKPTADWMNRFVCDKCGHKVSK